MKLKTAAALALFVFTLVSTEVTAQQSAAHTHEQAAFYHAMDIYNNQQYEAAQYQFEKIHRSTTDTNIKAECSYYIAHCAIRLGQPDAEQKMLAFVENYPASPRRNTAFFDVGNYYFDHGQYANARHWYGQVEERKLSVADRDAYNFHYGYTSYRANRPDEATTYLNRASNSTEYGSQARYYLGFMAYEEDDYDEADRFFETVEDENDEGLSYYQADRSFKRGEFQQAVELGLAQIDRANPKERSQLSKIIGESYFNLKQYERAVPYLKDYRGERGRWSNTDYYQLGYAHYQQGDYQAAISEFNKIISGKNHVAQNAYYHLAESYLKLGKKQQALNAFKHAWEMDFDDTIQEDAGYNYAKLSYELGNPYEPVPQVFISYLKKYPQSLRKAELKELLIDSYISSRNFKDAMDLLESDPGFADDAAYQTVAFFRGLELYHEDDLQSAGEHFQKSLNKPENARYTARATYWKAECDFRAERYTEAVRGFERYGQMAAGQNLPENEKLRYSLGYARFKTKDYTGAAGDFETYLSAPGGDAAHKADARLRLGDSYFASAQYWPALENYGKAVEAGGTQAGYAAFQQAISYGFVDRGEDKLRILAGFEQNHPRSTYRGHALYELGNTHLARDDNARALQAYDRLIKTLPNSSFVSKALLRKGLIYNNTDRPQEALSMFRRVANDFPNSTEAMQAVESAKLIYIDEGRIDDYASWVNTLDYVEVEDAELDEAAFTAAESRFAEGNKSVARERFEKYLKDFPNGLHSLDAHFYLGQIYFGESQKQKSIPHYRNVAGRGRNEYTDQALYRLSQIYLEGNDTTEAIPLLKRLEENATSRQHISFARINLMKALYETGNYSEAITKGESVLASGDADGDIRNDAHLIIARSAIKMGQEGKARTAYEQVRQNATGSRAAEAVYYDAYFKHRDKNYNASNERVQLLARDYASHKEYSARGLVIMAKNFHALDDAFQATYILENVIENFPDFPDITGEAKQELDRIKAEEAKTNVSVD